MDKENKELKDCKSQACVNLTNRNKIAGQKMAEKRELSFSEYVDKLIEKDLDKS